VPQHDDGAPPPRSRPARDTDPLTEIDLGQALRALRDWAGLTQQSLAARADLSDSTISARELGHGLPSVRFLDQFVTACLQHRGGLTAEQIVAELGHWQQARNDLYRQRRNPATPAPAPRPAVAPPPTPLEPEPAHVEDEPPAPVPTPDAEPPAAAEPEAPTVEPAAPPAEDAAPSSRGRGRWIWIAAAVLVAGSVTAPIAVNLLMGQRDGVEPQTPTLGATSPGRPVVPGQTYTETVNTAPGARTYTNPYGLIGEGLRISNGRAVQVSCKVAVPGAAPSVGVYWYLIADPPWNSQYYSPANAYLNGDPPQGPYTQEVDHQVPDCPE